MRFNNPNFRLYTLLGLLTGTVLFAGTVTIADSDTSSLARYGMARSADLIAECETESPLLLALGEQYYHIDGDKPDNEYEKPSKLFNGKASTQPLDMSKHSTPEQGDRAARDLVQIVDQQRFTSGYGIQVNCFDDHKGIVARVDNLELSNIHRITALNGTTFIKAQATTKDRYRSIERLLKVDLPPTVEWRPVSNVTAVTSSRMSRPNRFLLEVEVQVRADNDEVIIERIEYINGYKSSWMQWHLQT